MAITTPISYWKLDESSGNASDSIGSNTLTNVGTVTYSAGKINNGANFNGSSQYFTFGTSPQTGAGSWSVNVWVKTSVSGASPEFMFWGSQTTGNGIDLYMSSSNKLTANFYGGGGIATSTTSINTNSWVMCTITYDGSLLKVYVNGTLEATGASYAGNISGSVRYVGADSGAGNLWNGSLDELGAWNTTLTVDEISKIYNAGRGNQYPFTENLSTSLASYYKLDESSGNASDVIGSNTLTNTGTATYSAGKINNGVDFGATTQYLGKANPTGLQKGSGPFTMAAWVKFSNFSTARYFVGFGEYSNNKLVSLRCDSSTAWYIDDNGAAAAFPAVSSMSTGVWYHIVYTYPGSGNIYTAYLNGTSIGTANNTRAPNLGTTVMGLGSRSNTSAGENLVGSLDEVGFWSRALTSTEVTQLYNSGAGLQYPFGATTALVKALVIGGGGGGASSANGGGGAGGYQYDATHSVTVQAYTVTVGGGGATNGGNGSNSTFSTITATGGGAAVTNVVNGNGGCGGGGNYFDQSQFGGTGSQGGNGGKGRTGGGAGDPYSSGGGGGQSANGADGTITGSGKGGDGIINPIAGSTIGQLVVSDYWICGGGGGGADSGRLANSGGVGGKGGGGAGAQYLSDVNGVAGTANTGGGGGGGSNTGNNAAAAGGSGVVIIAYTTGTITATGGTVTTSGGDTIHSFTTSGTFTISATTQNNSGFFNLM